MAGLLRGSSKSYSSRAKHEVRGLIQLRPAMDVAMPAMTITGSGACAHCQGCVHHRPAQCTCPAAVDLPFPHRSSRALAGNSGNAALFKVRRNRKPPAVGRSLVIIEKPVEAAVRC